MVCKDHSPPAQGFPSQAVGLREKGVFLSHFVYKTIKPEIQKNL